MKISFNGKDFNDILRQMRITLEFTEKTREVEYSSNLKENPAQTTKMQSVSQESNLTTADTEGYIWDARIHARTKSKNADGTWRQKRNVDPKLVKQVLAEQKKQTQVPGQPSTQVPGQLPTQVPGQPPTQVPGQPPTQVPGQPPTQVPGQPPTQVPGQPPTQVPGQPPTQGPPTQITSQTLISYIQTFVESGKTTYENVNTLLESYGYADLINLPPEKLLEVYTLFKRNYGEIA